MLASGFAECVYRCDDLFRYALFTQTLQVVVPRFSAAFHGLPVRTFDVGSHGGASVLVRTKREEWSRLAMIPSCEHSRGAGSQSESVRIELDYLPIFVDLLEKRMNAYCRPICCHVTDNECFYVTSCILC